ncbi:cytochrome b5 domain-containing protein [Clostridium cellulovorans]|uniref:Cytochrome b5 n=1 Tax=Clostridium cellulovorans (strain ATCC 35296 / DSM 3052 / OCM 3 / 743B) TaxID=573061 RepID=D9SPK2_CLOC7|nr:cytochrome b5 domain-containing protein [Clostridium cellulovorans]ADL50051.1 cytochrome b5 [Clostridium cellulovorans 743B]
MAFYIDARAVNELMRSKNYREEKNFTLEELAQYDGSNGKSAYVAIKGIVYDVTKEPTWEGAEHFNIKAGKDLTKQFDSCHGEIELLHDVPKVGVLIESDNEKGSRNIPEPTYAFSPDDWIRYLTPLVNQALEEANVEPNTEHVLQKYIMAGVFVGQGRSIEDAIKLVSEWEDTGLSKLLEQSKTKQRLM